MPVRIVSYPPHATQKSSVLLRAFQSRKSGKDTRSFNPVLERSDHAQTIRSLSRYGKGRSNTAFTTVKIIVVPPIPRASDSVAASVKPGDFHKTRSECAMSLKMFS